VEIAAGEENAMLVQDIMTRPPLVAGPEMSILEAQDSMAEHDIHHLPIVDDGGRLLGLITRQCLPAEPERAGRLDAWERRRYLSTLTVGDVMIGAADVVTISPEAPLEDAARIMVERHIGCLPVIGGGVVTGLITETDLLRQLTEMMAASRPGVRVTVHMPNRPGALARLAAAIAAQGWHILALGGAPMSNDPDRWAVVVKLDGDRQAIVDSLSRVPAQQVVDARET
jgi:acetoin utilization protein AcuB